MKTEMTRKEFLQQLMFLGLVAGTGGSLLAGCGKKEESAETAQTSARRPQATETAPEAATGDPCADVSGLTEMELKMRKETLKYVAATPDPEKRCDNCKFWVPAETGGACGACQLIKGPIHPNGYCTSWFVQDT
jgi:hypothetical protein